MSSAADSGTESGIPFSMLSPAPLGFPSLGPSPPLALLSGWERDVSRQATAKVCRYFLQERGEQWEGDTDIKDDSQLT